MRKLFDVLRRVFQTALTHRHEFVVAVVTFAADHRLIVGVGFAALLGLWFVVNAVFDIRRSLKKWRMSFHPLLWACAAG